MKIFPKKVYISWKICYNNIWKSQQIKTCDKKRKTKLCKIKKEGEKK